MKKYLFASVREGTGKTTVITGLSQLLGKEKTGYFKPMGDHLVYKKKKLWDMDGALMKEVLGFPYESQDVTVGFDHSKMRYMHDEKTLAGEILKRADKLSQGKEYLLIEGPSSFHYAHSLNLDPVSISKCLEAPVIVVVKGSTSQILDSVDFAKKLVESEGADFKGVVISDIQNISSINEEVVPELEEMSVPILGKVEHKAGLSMRTVSFIAERLFAKVIAGEKGMGNHISQVFVGAMAASHARRHPGWKDPMKLIITAGDRDDLIAAAVEDGASCLVITNDLVPSPNILARADLRGVPILQVPTDTFTTAKKIEEMETLTMPDEAGKIDLAREAVENSGLVEQLK